MRCAEHPNVETALRCGKCDKPICPKCMVQTPVGARCKSCAQLRRLPMFDVSASQYAIAVGVGFLLTVFVGAVWSFLAIPFISFWIPIGVGYLIGEVVSHAVNRKRSVGLQVIVGLSIFSTYVMSRMVPYMIANIADPLAIANIAAIVQLFVWITVGTVTQPYTLVILALGIYLGVTRVR